MEVILGIIVLGVLFIIFGGVENKDNKSEAGKEMIANLEGTAKIVQENGGGCLLWGGFIIVVLAVIIAVMSGEKLW